jgi:type I restriction enzyme S subunit
MTSKAHEVARKTLNLEDVRSALVAIPPLAEQGVIINEIESKLSIAENAEEVINQSQERSEKLRQSILKLAFNGRLVPQDSNDEPASMLLGRMMTERAELVKGTRGMKNNNTRQMRLIND